MNQVFRGGSSNKNEWMVRSSPKHKRIGTFFAKTGHTCVNDSCIDITVFPERYDKTLLHAGHKDMMMIVSSIVTII